MSPGYEQLKERLARRADSFRVRTVAAANAAGVDRKDPLRPVIEPLASMPGLVLSGVADLLAAAAAEARRAEQAQLEKLATQARRDRYLVTGTASLVGAASAAAVACLYFVF